MTKNELTPKEKGILKKMYWRSGLVFSTFNQTKMEGNAFCATMAPALEDLYKDDPEEYKKALVRHDQFFNTHAVLFAFIAGLTYALEKQKVESHGEGVNDDTIENIKVALMGPTAGIGDAFFFNTVRVIAAGIAMGLCAQGNILGVIIFLLLYGGSQMIARWYLLKIGYTAGTSFIDKVFSSGLISSLTKAASIVGLGMVGAMVASMVNVPVAWTINIGGAAVVVSDILDGIMPGILSIGLVFLMVRLLKKGVSPIKIVLGVLVLSLLLAFVGIF